VTIGGSLVVAKPVLEQLRDDRHELGLPAIALGAQHLDSSQESLVVAPMLGELGVASLLHLLFFVLEVAAHVIEKLVEHHRELGPRHASVVSLTHFAHQGREVGVLRFDAVGQRGAFPVLVHVIFILSQDAGFLAHFATSPLTNGSAANLPWRCDRSFEHACDGVSVVTAARAELETWRPPSRTMRATRRSRVDVVALGDSERLAANDPIASLDRIPHVIVPWDALAPFEPTAEEVFLLTLIDGNATVEEVLDMSGAPPYVSMPAFRRLLELGVISLRSR